MFRSLGLALLAASSVWSQSQTRMNSAAKLDYDRADAELNSVYSEVLKKHAKNTPFVSKMRTAQRAWIAFRDAHVNSVFPAADTASEYGSIYPLCRLQVLTELTRARTTQLRSWIKGAPEGDTCAGSRALAARNGPVSRCEVD